MKSIFYLGAILLFSGFAFGQTTLSLSAAKDSALRNNRQLKSANFELQKANELKKEAFTNYFPKASITGGAYYAFDPLLDQSIEEVNLPVYDGNPVNLANPTQFTYFPGMDVQMFEYYAVGVANVTQPLYAGGRIANGNKLAEVNQEVKELQVTVAERDILLKVEEQYWLLISLKQKQDILKQYEELLNTVEVQVADAKDAGLVVKNDLLKIQLKQNEVELNKEKLQNAYELVLRQFCQNIGVKYSVDIELSESTTLIQSPAAFYVPSDTAVVQRPEYDLLQQSLAAADLQKKMASGENLPQLALGVSGFYAHPLDRDLNTTTNGMVYATVSIPVSDWWGGAYKLKQLELDKKIAQNTFEETSDLLLLHTEKLWKDMGLVYSQINIQQNTIAQAEENLKVSQNGYDSGIVTISDLLEAQVVLYESKVALAELHQQYMMAVSSYVQHTTNK